MQENREQCYKRKEQVNWESTCRRTENRVTKDRSRLTRKVRAGELRTELQKTGASELGEYEQEN